MRLYPYQERAIRQLRDQFRAGKRRVILSAPTGSGKTVIAMEIAKLAIGKGQRIAFVADTKTLVRQTADRFSQRSIPHVMLMSNEGVDDAAEAQVVIASAQTVESRGLKSIGSRSLVIVDECHTIRTRLMTSLKDRGAYVIGMSATPFKELLLNYYDDLINVTTTDELLQSGYLSPVKVRLPDVTIDTKKLRLKSTGEFRDADIDAEAIAIVGDVVKEYTRQATRLFGGVVPTVVFTAGVDAAEQVAEAFRQANHDFTCVHYKLSSAETKARIADFADGKYDGIVNSVMLTKGFDVPHTRILVDLFPTRTSLTRLVQRYGRVMRTAKEKNFALLLDHAGNMSRFGEEIAGFYQCGAAWPPYVKKGGEEKAYCIAATETRPDGTKEGGWFCGFRVNGEDDVDIDNIRFTGDAARVAACSSKEADWVIAEIGEADLGDRYRNIRVVSLPELAYDEVGAEGRDKRVDPEALTGGLRDGTTLDGSTPLIDWWLELQRYGAQKYPKDPFRAKKRALGVYRNRFGKWPPKDRPYRHRPSERPHTYVHKAAEASFEHWIEMRSRRRARPRSGR